jgi:hypothetical protein
MSCKDIKYCLFAQLHAADFGITKRTAVSRGVPKIIARQT